MSRPGNPLLVLHLLIAVYTVLHVTLAAWLPLSAHEALYAHYARALKWSYLDHPPLMAWLQSLMQLVSTSDFAMRVLPIGLSVAAQYLLARLARTLYPDASPWLPVLSVLVLQGTLIFHGSLTLTPDAVLVPLALLVVPVAIRCVSEDAWRDWLKLGVLLGLAGLAKYTAVTLALSLVLLVLLQRGLRGLAAPKLWLAGMVALLLITPVIWWNWQNDWLTVRFHAAHQLEDANGWSGVELLKSSVEQVAYYSPVLVIGGFIVLWRYWRPPWDRRDRTLAVPVFVVPVLLVYLVAALESRASPHWSVLGWLLLIPSLVRWLMDRWRASRGVRALVWASAGYSLIILLAIPVLVLPVGRWPDFQHPIRNLAGWSAAARHGDALRRELDPDGRDTEPVLLARNWHHAGLLSWYAPDAEVRTLFLDLNPHNVHVGYADHVSWGVLVYPRATRDPYWKNLTRDFDCQPIDALPVHFGESLVRVFHFYACESKLTPPDQNASPTPK